MGGRRQNAYVRTSGIGTFETCRPTPRKSANRGRPEVSGEVAKTPRLDPGCAKTLCCCYDSSVILWGAVAKMPMYGLPESALLRHADRRRESPLIGEDRK